MEKTKHFLPLLVKGGIKAIMREEKLVSKLYTETSGGFVYFRYQN